MSTLIQKIKTIVKNELHANASPLRASFSLALGILIGFSPFYGLHTIIVIPLAFLFRLNRPLALLAESTTILPFVPFWVAAGILAGKLTIPISWCEHLVQWATLVIPPNNAIASVTTFIRGLFPPVLFEKLPVDGHHMAAGFIQWALGSCVLAIVSAALTVAVTYPIFLHFSRKQQKRI
jgi:uncharacterized protein (DUF2062 family)